MAQKVAEYPDVHVTFNITPSLIRQINDLASGARDIYWALAVKPVSELTDAEKQFILERFFDANWTNVIPLFPRYQEFAGFARRHDRIRDPEGGGNLYQSGLHGFTGLV